MSVISQQVTDPWTHFKAGIPLPGEMVMATHWEVYFNYENGVHQSINLEE